MAKLNQIIAVEKGVKSKITSEVSELYKKIQKPDLFNGFSKKYESIDEEGEQFSPEDKKVIMSSGEILTKIEKHMGELFDIIYTKDQGNLVAKADIIVDGITIATNVPSTYILFLEKQLIDIRTMINVMPTLDINENWIIDPNSNLYKTDSITTNRTKKIIKVLVKYEATKEHPAQTDLINEDVLIGYWKTTKLSGAISIPDKEKLMDKIDKLIKAVKYAREAANNTDVSHNQISNKIFDYLFK